MAELFRLSLRGVKIGLILSGPGPIIDSSQTAEDQIRRLYRAFIAGRPRAICWNPQQALPSRKAKAAGSDIIVKESNRQRTVNVYLAGGE